MDNGSCDPPKLGNQGAWQDTLAQWMYVYLFARFYYGSFPFLMVEMGFYDLERQLLSLAGVVEHWRCCTLYAEYLKP